MAWTKDSSNTLDYTFNWQEWLNEGDSIASYNFSLEGGDDSLSILGQDLIDNNCIVLLSGGTPQTGYTIKCSITTADGLVEHSTRGIFIMN